MFCHLFDQLNSIGRPHTFVALAYRLARAATTDIYTVVVDTVIAVVVFLAAHRPFTRKQLTEGNPPHVVGHSIYLNGYSSAFASHGFEIFNH